MKLRWILAIGLGALVIVGLAVGLLSPDSAQTALAETRQALRQQGFKIDLKEFDFSVPAEVAVRAAALTNAEPTAPRWTVADYARRTALTRERFNLMAPAGSNAALVVWKQERLTRYSGQLAWLAQKQPEEDLWPALREASNESRAELDAACQAALSGPIRFNLDASHGSAMLLPHLVRLRDLAQTLGNRVVLELHDGNKDAAWTNLLASTRLVTAWDPEPAEVSHGVRYACAAIVYNTTWQALQAGGWPDDRLAQLQDEWAAADFFKRLPETAAFSRASMTATCQLERRQPFPLGSFFKELLHAPRYAWQELIGYWRRVHYRHHGSYEDERALLLHYRDRELELRRAVLSPRWSEMRQLPGVTNLVPFVSKHSSAMQSMMNLRQISLATQLYQQGGGGYGRLGRAADAEARRRLIITALALERHRGRHGSYPQTLHDLAPELLPQPPTDFMDGQPLRYRLIADGHFILYSVGLDCVDNGGEMRRPRGRRTPSEVLPGFGLLQAVDLVWPRPASAAEVQAQKEVDEKQAALERAAAEERWADVQKQTEAERQAAVEKLLAEAAAKVAAPPSSSEKLQDPTYQGRPLSQLLRNETTAGTNRLSLEALLTVRQVITGQEPDIATFEVPVRYAAATNVGRIHLVVDGGLDAASLREEGERQTCERAANGNCLLGWLTTYDPPGKHAIQAEFITARDEDNEEAALKVRGPVVAFVSTNLCQFDSAYDHFDERGVTLYAKLPESNGLYTIELKSPAGAHLRTLTGTTSNGVIKVHWDLLDDHGRRCTNDAVDSVFHITLSGSGRSQSLKGP